MNGGESRSFGTQWLRTESERPPEAEMPAQALWAGVPAIKGSSEPVRMALLTFSLIGLQ